MRTETRLGSRIMQRRYYLMHRAREARTVGILAGTLGVAGYAAVIEQLRLLLRRAGKHSYTFAIGAVTAAKLANFAEIDVFVLVACPESSLLDNRVRWRADARAMPAAIAARACSS